MSTVYSHIYDGVEVGADFEHSSITVGDIVIFFPDYHAMREAVSMLNTLTKQVNSVLTRQKIELDWSGE